ncbi:DUF4873 domain-containing protein [Mycobacterium deserti]|uniref:DUF4873 domain-containing protein n=1 Tax=Mycobacterium deserti TaxID=2978347 RepID=A0ABT2M676_9MYCO|nr:DUF4873 domain-containing protein [Mycobacterium deserti]MCT7657431.1 DUF4873 domain-containing protein [Mycobacterium deserti]
MTDDVLLVDEEIVDAAFDESTHTWTVRTRNQTQQARIVIAANGQLPETPVKDNVELTPFLGVAVHGVPNYFILTGPDSAQQKRYIGECLERMRRRGSSRIEVRYSTQRSCNERATQTNWRRMRDKISSDFDFGSIGGLDDEVYDGQATLHIADGEAVSRVRLTGRIDPIDGRYHWQGTVLGSLPHTAKLPQRVALTIGGRTAEARLTERTPQGGYSVVGVGTPPYERPATVSTTTATTREISSG